MSKTINGPVRLWATGKAGVGKEPFLKELAKDLSKDYAVTKPSKDNSRRIWCIDVSPK